MARTLVTGATGFIGNRLVAALLARGEEVMCLLRPGASAEKLRKSGAQLITGDVTQAATLPAAIANADVVYHLAGLTRANRLSDYLRANEEGVRNVLDACARRTTAPVVVLVSSLAAAGPMADRNRFRTECDPLHPVSHYGVSKLAGERAAEAFADRVPITIVRPPIVLGPGDVTGFALFKSIRRLRSFLVLGSKRRASIIHVADLNAALIASAQHGERLPARDETSPESNSNGRGRYFVAADEHPTFAELSRMVARSLNRPYALAIRLPLAAIWPVVVPGEIAGRITGRARYLSCERAREFTAGHWICSAEKAKRDLGFSPGAPLAERIKQTADWYLREGWL
jgi:nucleoside-diphosphate-sugar epimerase